MLKWAGIFTPAVLLGAIGYAMLPADVSGDLLEPGLLLGVIALFTSAGALTQATIALVVELVVSSRARARGEERPGWRLTFVTFGVLTLASGALYVVLQSLSMLSPDLFALWYAALAMGVASAGGVFAASCAVGAYVASQFLRK